MKALQISKADRRGGGASAVATELCAALNAAGDSCQHLIGWRGDPAETAQILAYAGAKGFALKSLRRALEVSGWPDHFAVEAPLLRSLSCIHDADILHFHDISGFCAPQTALELARIRPAVWTLHDFSAFTAGCINPLGCEKHLDRCGPCPQIGHWPLRSRFDHTRALHHRRRQLLEAADIQLICPSQFLADEVARSVALRRAPVVIPNAADLDVFRPQEKTALRLKLGLPVDTRIVLISTGDVNSRFKGYPQALERIRALAPDCTFLAIGEVKDASVFAGLNYIASGFISDRQRLADFFAASDLLLYPTLADNLPRVVIEALACGVPTIGFATGGVPEIVESGVAGELAGRGDFAALTASFASVIHDTERLQRWSLAARKKAEQVFSMERMLALHREIYRETIARGASRNGILESRKLQSTAHDLERLLERELRRRTARYISFDLFDTLLFRSCVRPEQVFQYAADRARAAGILDESAAQRCYQARLTMEAQLLRQGLRAPALSRIYAAIEAAVNLPHDVILKLEQIELDTEFDLLYTTDEARAVVQQARASGAVVFFVSDMYLPAEFLRKLLVRESLIKDDELLYVSCEEHATKATGALYRKIRKQLGVRRKEWLHIGDNRRIDGRSAQRSGVRSICYEGFAPLRYERILSRIEPLRQGAAPAKALSIANLAGRARQRRLGERRLRRGDERAAYELGLNVGGPALAPLTHWMLREAERFGLNRLYFVARDGQILLEIARRLDISSNVKLEYLYGSRAAWRPASINAIDDAAIRLLFQDFGGLTLEGLARRLRLEAPVLAAALRASGWKSAVGLADPLDKHEQQQIRQAAREEACAALILQQTRAARRGALAYLRSAGLFDSGKRGIADLGWAGSLQDSLDAILASVDAAPCDAGFYAGLKANASARKSAFYFHPESPREALRMGLDSALTLEVLAMANHGSVLGYAEQADGTARVDFAPEDGAAHAWNLDAFRQGVFDFVEEYRRVSSELRPEDLRDNALEILASLARNPTPVEARLLGAIPFTTDMASPARASLAAPLSAGAALARRIRLSLGASADALAWPSGAAALSGRISAALTAPRRSFGLAVSRLARFLTGAPGGRRLLFLLKRFRTPGFGD